MQRRDFVRGMAAPMICMFKEYPETEHQSTQIWPKLLDMASDDNSALSIRRRTVDIEDWLLVHRAWLWGSSLLVESYVFDSKKKLTLARAPDNSLLCRYVMHKEWRIIQWSADGTQIGEITSEVPQTVLI